MAYLHSYQDYERDENGVLKETEESKEAIKRIRIEHEKEVKEMCALFDQRELDCKENYYTSPFYNFFNMKKEDFLSGEDRAIGNDSRYYFFNQICEMELPLEVVAAENPSFEYEHLLYYYIYKDTIIVTHGFDDILFNKEKNEHYINRSYERFPELYDIHELNGINTMPFISEFRITHLDKHIRAEHKHLPLKILYTKSRTKALCMVTDSFDSYTDAIFYKQSDDLREIFKQ